MQELQSIFLSPIHAIASELSGGDSMAKGLIVVGILGGLVALCRNLPQKLYEVVKRKILVSITVSKDVQDINQIVLFALINDFIGSHTKLKSFKVFDASSTKQNVNLGFGPNTGKFWFYHQGTLFFFYSRSEAVGNENNNVPEQVTLSWIGSKPEKLFKFIKKSEDVFYRNFGERFFRLPSETDNYWSIVSKISESNELIISEKVKTRLDNALKNFKDNQEWFSKRGLPHKLVIVLYGPPGTGKTSLTRYVADYLKKDICVMTTKSMTNEGFPSLVRQSSINNGVVSIQDFDVYSAFHKRNENHDSQSEGVSSIDKGNEKYQEKKSSVVFSSLSLSTILNTFQGDIPLSNCVVVMTTNHIEKIDPAVIRSGRVDLMLEVGCLEIAEVQKFYETYFETSEKLPAHFDDIQIKAAELMGAFLDNTNDPEAFKKYLESNLSNHRSKNEMKLVA